MPWALGRVQIARLAFFGYTLAVLKRQETFCMKRIIAALIPAVWMLSLGLAACTPDAAPSPTQLSTAAAPAQTAVKIAPTARTSSTAAPKMSAAVDSKQLRGVEVRFWHPWSGSEAQVVNEIVEAFNRDNIWGLRVIPTATGGSSELLEQASAAIKSGQPPSLVAAPVDHILYWQQMGKVVVDLNPYSADPDWGLTDAEVKDYYPVFWQQDLIEGQRLGIPAEREARVLFYNAGWAKELGFDQPPATLADFQKQACAAAKANAQDGLKANDGMGGWIFDRNDMTLMSWMRAAGAKIPAAADTHYRFNSAEAVKAFDFLRKLYDLGCTWNSRNPLPYEYFATRAALFYSGSLADVDMQEHTQERLNSQDAWQVIPFPTLDAKPIMLTGGPSYAIFRSSPEEQMGAWLFIRWMMLPRNQVRLVEASGSLPLSKSVLEGLGNYADQQPHWKQVLDDLPLLESAPVLPDWWMMRNVLEDAGWQLLQLTPQPAHTLLEQMDATIPEILKNQP
jgi:multiple sugar transport system substrate-binding protein